jgi:hypothetical protein
MNDDYGGSMRDGSSFHARNSSWYSRQYFWMTRKFNKYPWNLVNFLENGKTEFNDWVLNI